MHHTENLSLYDYMLVIDDRLAAAGRLRSAVALELVAGKVWALPIAVQPARGIHCRNGTGSPRMG